MSFRLSFVQKSRVAYVYLSQEWSKGARKIATFETYKVDSL